MLAYIFICVCIHSAAPVKYKLRPVRMIALKDYTFIGEDPKLRAELRRRMGYDSHTIIQGTEDYNNTDLPDFLVMDENAYLNRSLRRQTFNDPKEYTLNFKTLDMIRQAIYATQYRLDIMDKIMAKYVNDEKFRVAYMFGKIEEWLHFMKTIWTVVEKTKQFDNNPEKRRFRVYKHLLYYAHMLRRNIDITYTVEEIVRIHNEIYASIVSKEEERT